MVACGRAIAVTTETALHMAQISLLLFDFVAVDFFIPKSKHLELEKYGLSTQLKDSIWTGYARFQLGKI